MNAETGATPGMALRPANAAAMAEMKGRTATLINSTDIAAMAHVSNGAVSNWRRRSLDFPPPVRGPKGKPLFDYDEVVAWLDANGKEYTDRRMQQLLWTLSERLRESLGQEKATTLVIVMLCLKKASIRYGLQDEWSAISASSGRRTATEAMRTYVQSVRVMDGCDEKGPRLSHVLAVADRVLMDDLPVVDVAGIVKPLDGLTEGRLGDLCDMLLDTTIRSDGRAGGEHGFIGSKVSLFMADLAVTGAESDSQAGAADGTWKVYDSACGIGVAALGIAERHPQTTCFLSDISEWAVFVVEARFFLRAGEQNVPVLTRGDSLRSDSQPGVMVDIAVVEPPFRERAEGLRASDPRWAYGVGGRAESGFHYMQDALAHLAETGRAYVCTAGGALFRSSADAEVRRRLLAEGCVEAVIMLPRNLLLSTSIPVCIWVLTGPDARRESVLLLDCSGTFEPRGTQGLPEWIAGPVRRLCGENLAWAAVSVRNLLSCDNAGIIFARWMRPKGASSSSIVEKGRNLASSIHDDLRRIDEDNCILRRLPSRLPDMEEATTVTVGGLVEQGELTLLMGDASVEEGSGNHSDVIRPRDLSDGDDLHKPRTPEGKRGIRTEPGDVLVIPAGDVRASVDTEGGHRVSRPIGILRIAKGSGWNPQYLALCLVGEWNQALRQGAALLHVNVKKLEIPMADMERQRELVRIAQAARTAERLGESARRYVDVLRNAIRYGSGNLASDDAHADVDGNGGMGNGRNNGTDNGRSA